MISAASACVAHSHPHPFPSAALCFSRARHFRDETVARPLIPRARPSHLGHHVGVSAMSPAALRKKKLIFSCGDSGPCRIALRLLLFFFNQKRKHIHISILPPPPYSSCCHHGPPPRPGDERNASYGFRRMMEASPEKRNIDGRVCRGGCLAKGLGGRGTGGHKKCRVFISHTWKGLLAVCSI